MSPTLTSSAAMLSLVAPDRWVEAGEDEPVVVKAEPDETRAESRRANRTATMVQFVEHRYRHYCTRAIYTESGHVMKKGPPGGPPFEAAGNRR